MKYQMYLIFTHPTLVAKLLQCTLCLNWRMARFVQEMTWSEKDRTSSWTKRLHHEHSVHITRAQSQGCYC